MLEAYCGLRIVELWLRDCDCALCVAEGMCHKVKPKPCHLVSGTGSNPTGTYRSAHFHRGCLICHPLVI
eukprot:scaffold1296_cov268-Skeletonema_marinoi.AAC.2